MRIARLQLPSGLVAYGCLQGTEVILLNGSPFEGHEISFSTEKLPLDEVRLLAPVEPTKIVGIGRNYAAHAVEHQAEIPPEPLFFLKPPSSVVGPEQAIVLTPLSQRVEYEAELAAVIGQRARHLTLGAALSSVFGYTCANDVTARDLQRRDGQWSRAKGFDTFCPIGPWIETDLVLRDQLIQCKVNDSLRQEASVGDMVFDLATLLVHVTAAMTLEPGDVLLTGTPAGVGPLMEGDEVTVSIEGIGDLRNQVRRD